MYFWFAHCPFFIYFAYAVQQPTDRRGKKSPKKLELVLTGRGDISRIEEYADYVTILVEKKHPFRAKIGARRGVEY